MAITENELHVYVDQHIKDICTTAYAADNVNHCAHFVSHALGIKLGMLCGDMKFNSRRTGASIRCDEIFNALAQRGPWSEKPAAADGLLVFVTSVRNVSNNVMANVPQKHVGIHFNGRVFNYSNSKDKVVSDATTELFLAKFKQAYSSDVALFFGVVP